MDSPAALAHVAIHDTVVQPLHAGFPVTLPVELSDGDAIRIGSVLLTFHTRAASRSTVTQSEGAP